MSDQIRWRFAIGAAAIAALLTPAAASACRSAGYAYAGVAASRASYGVSADLTAAATPLVESGHVAGWVGVGGVGLGPHGTNEWIQVGFSAFPGSGTSNLYYEVARPGRAPVYTEVANTIPIGLTRSVAVLEMAHRRNWWRVWVNGHSVGSPVHLPGSHAAWRPIATAESWGGGRSACNSFAYRFERVSVARAPGGGWHRLSDSYYTFHNPGFEVRRTAGASFLASARRDDSHGTTGAKP